MTRRAPTGERARLFQAAALEALLEERYELDDMIALERRRVADARLRELGRHVPPRRWTDEMLRDLLIRRRPPAAATTATKPAPRPAPIGMLEQHVRALVASGTITGLADVQRLCHRWSLDDIGAVLDELVAAGKIDEGSARRYFAGR